MQILRNALAVHRQLEASFYKRGKGIVYVHQELLWRPRILGISARMAIDCQLRLGNCVGLKFGNGNEWFLRFL